MRDNGTFFPSSLEVYSRDLVKVNRVRDLTAAQEARKIGYGVRDWERKPHSGY